MEEHRIEAVNGDPGRVEQDIGRVPTRRCQNPMVKERIPVEHGLPFQQVIRVIRIDIERQRVTAVDESKEEEGGDGKKDTRERPLKGGEKGGFPRVGKGHYERLTPSRDRGWRVR